MHTNRKLELNGVRPPVEGLDLLKLQLSAPVTWAESYEMYGERKPYVDSLYDLSDYNNYAEFKAKCVLCTR